MKRENHHLHPHPLPPPLLPDPSSNGKSKLWEENEKEEEALDGGGMDELLAVLGYKVKSSDMLKVAHNIEKLEQAIGQVHDFTNPFDNNTHFNPSDLSSWLESMLSEIHPPPPPPSFPPPPESESESVSTRETKRLKSKPSSSDSESVSISISRPVILVDDDSSSSSCNQENGIQLVHALMACAESIQQNNLNLAEALVKRIGFLAVSQAGAMGKVATFFAEALARRIYNLAPDYSISESDFLQTHFYESCPYLKFAHFTANQAILEAFEGKKRVHVIDFSMNQGMQWPALIQALALRPNGPPVFRLTGIGPPAPDNSDYLHEVGLKLAQLAKMINVEFEYRGYVASSLADLNSSMLDLRPSDVESVVVNSVFELHKLLARPGAIEKVLSVVKEMKPEIVTVVEQEANHNGPVFLDRFTESLHYYSTLFDSLEGSVDNEDKIMSEMYLGKQICNVVAGEGVDRVERHETLNQWRNRLTSAGFEPVHLGSNAFKQASMLLALSGDGEGYRVEENDGSLMLGWHTRPLIATSAWKIKSGRNHHNHHHHRHRTVAAQ